MYSLTVLVGRLTKDPEAREVTINGEQQWVCNFSVATDDRGKTDFHDIVVWRKLAENCKNFLSKGKMVAVEGKYKKRNYEGTDGKTVWVSELIADEVRFLSPKGEGGAPANQQAQQQAPQQQPYAQQQQQPYTQQQAPQQQQPYTQQQQQPPYQQQQQQPYAQQPYQGTAAPTGYPIQVSDDDLPF